MQRHYALAAVSRSQLSMKLRKEINLADRNISKQLTQVNALTDPLLRAQKMYGTKSAFNSREQSQRDLQIVDNTGAGLPPKWTWKDIDVRIDRELAKMTVGETVLLDTSGELAELLQSAITASGMQYVNMAAAYRLQGSLEIQDVGLQDGWYWQRGALQVDLLANAGNKVMASARFPLKSSGQSRHQSLIRMQSEIARLLNNELKHALLRFGEEEKIQQ